MDGQNKKISKDNLIKEMKYLSTIYDRVRLVNPEATSVYALEGDQLVLKEMESCFSLWKKDKQCTNCISIQACHEKKRMNKFEFFDDETFYVFAVPYLVEEGSGYKAMSLELVNKVTDDFISQGQGYDNTSHLLRSLNDKVYRDSLTGAFNRRYYDEKRYLYDSVRSFPKSIGFLLMNINQFKIINETYGHVHGDELLTKIAEILSRNFRDSDRIIRIGGDEFLIVLKDCQQGFLDKKAESVKKVIRDIEFGWLDQFIPSVSIGKSFLDNFDGSLAQVNHLFEEADKNLTLDRLAPIPTTPKKTILIVDDVEMNREIIRNDLQNQFVIYEAVNGQEALDVLKKNHIDLVVTDIFMDVMNGYELMKNIRRLPHTKNTPIIAITENEESSQTKAIVSGADYFIEKPINRNTVYKIIMQLLGQDHGRSDLFNVDFVLDCIPGAVIVSKFKADVPEILYCSRGVYNIAGVDAGEFADYFASQGSRLVFPSDFKLFNDCIQKIIHNRSHGEVIFRSQKSNGDIIWLWLQGRCIGQEDGYPIIEEIILDVSNSTNMYENILDESSNVVIIIDRKSHEILYVNSKAKEIFDCHVGESCHEVFYHRKDKCENCVINSKDDKGEKIFTHKGRYYRQIFKPMNWNGRFAFLGCMDDITDQKELQEYTQREKDELSQIIQKVPAGLFVFKLEKDGNVTLIEANPTAIELMGIDKNKTIGSTDRRVFELTHPEDRELIANMIKKLYVPETTVAYEYRQFNITKGDYCWLAARAHSVLQSDGTINAYISYFDITEQKNAQKLKEDLYIAQRENQSKSDFMSNMSHDMRTPLNGILGLAHLMLDSTDINELHEDAKQLLSSGRLLLGLINDTLDMNKIESGKFEIHNEPMDSGAVFKSVMNTVGMQAAQAHIHIAYDIPSIPEDKWVSVVGDSLRIQQIMINVISNAIKFSKPGGVVELHMKTLSIDSDFVIDEYKIVDHGIGMSKQFLEHIYEPFIQEGRGSHKMNQGSGLGMAIVKQLVELMDSTITIESELDKGTTVTLHMKYPVYKGKPILKESLSLQEDDIDLTNMHILLCEDHPLNRDIIIKLLNKKGAIVDVATHGKEGVEIFNQSPKDTYDAIIMDIRMPIMDGLEATRIIRKLDREDAHTIPIIAMTANAFAEDKEETSRAGMNEHLAKPVESQILYHTLYKYYKNKRT